MVEIADITQISYDNPSRWEGVTVDGEEIFIDYNWGMLRIDLDDEIVFNQEFGDELDYYIEWEDIEDILEEL